MFNEGIVIFDEAFIMIEALNRRQTVSLSTTLARMAKHQSQGPFKFKYFYQLYLYEIEGRNCK